MPLPVPLQLKRRGPAQPVPPPTGKTDLLLRFFDSQFFDSWIALTYLYKSNSPGVQDYLCNRLYELPEAGLERYLLQLTQLVIERPHSSLERVIVDLCSRSLRVAVKVCAMWVLQKPSQAEEPCNFDRRDDDIRTFLLCRFTGCCWRIPRTTQKTCWCRS
jgi:hypothetical protein